MRINFGGRRCGDGRTSGVVGGVCVGGEGECIFSRCMIENQFIPGGGLVATCRRPDENRAENAVGGKIKEKKKK